MPLNSSSASYNLEYHCSASKVSIFIVTGISAMRIILLLPLCTFILYLGHQQWRQQRSSKTESHSAIFTYHLAAMELLWVCGCVLSLLAIYAHFSVVTTVGLFFCNIGIFGEILFHLLTCGERYLAVVHPTTYRGLRNTRGIRIRNISIACVWLFCFILTCLYKFLKLTHSDIILFCLFTSALMFLSFCSISVLCVLIGPGPGDGRRAEKVDQSKRRAFQSIAAISCVVWVWFVGELINVIVDRVAGVGVDAECVVGACLSGFNLPSCLVQPLLYLHKAGKLRCSRSQ